MKKMTLVEQGLWTDSDKGKSPKRSNNLNSVQW